MNMRPLSLLALLMGLSFAAAAQTAAPAEGNAQPQASAAPAPAPAAASGQRAATPREPKPVDLAILVPKDSAAKKDHDYRPNDRYNRRGVNCSLYPARCY